MSPATPRHNVHRGHNRIFLTGWRPEDYDVVAGRPRAGAVPVVPRFHAADNSGLIGGNDLVCALISGVDCGATDKRFTASYAFIGVGDSSVPTEYTMVGLQGTNKKFKLVGSSTPAWDSDTHELYYRAAFISGEADFEWCEIVLVSYDNGGSAPVTGIEAGCTALGRALFDVPFETKGTGLVWEAEYRVKWL